MNCLVTKKKRFMKRAMKVQARTHQLFRTPNAGLIQPHVERPAMPGRPPWGALITWDSTPGKEAGVRRPGTASDILCGLDKSLSLSELVLRSIKWEENCSQQGCLES